MEQTQNSNLKQQFDSFLFDSTDNLALEIKSCKGSYQLTFTKQLQHDTFSIDSQFILYEKSRFKVLLIILRVKLFARLDWINY